MVLVLVWGEVGFIDIEIKKKKICLVWNEKGGGIFFWNKGII